ncbi:hypothetical protein [Paenibacillus donghaensis]|uniref:hypothetical protein n=1 Tax=Paenibacillus donghaensis TaxID=414771 RepID=UPI0014713871|nr:hypothetical protein [Paenibacillus donghaensis]
MLDFGDCEYHWFAYDLAIAIYHTAQTMKPGPERITGIQQFFSSFIDGYARGNPEITFIAQIDDFINYRHLFSYAYHSVFSDPSQLSSGQLSYLQDMRQSVLDGSSFLGCSLS